MSFSARIVLDSLNPASGGHRLTTFMLTYPRFIHSELMTHRVFSRNAASSRAIPYAQMRQAVLTNPAMPMHWGQNQKGMQADEQIGATRVPDAVRIWNEATVTAVHHADKLAEMGVHKQVVNRLLEPFMHITTLVTATEWTNFFALRAHKDAQPEFQFLADFMLQLYVDGTPSPRFLHAPFVNDLESALWSRSRILQASVAQCARVSYVKRVDQPTSEEDAALYSRLQESGHWSPFEHVAFAVDEYRETMGNLRGWRQHRHDFVNYTDAVDLPTLYRSRRDLAPPETEKRQLGT